MKKTLVTVAVATFLLAGCGNDKKPESHETPSATPTSDMSVQNGDSGDEGITEEDEPMETAKVGESFRFNSFDADNNIYHWDVKVTKVEVTDELKKAADNPEYDGGNAEYVDAKPAKGNEFLHVKYEATNVSGGPEYLNLRTEVEFADGEVYAPLGDDRDDYTPNLTEQNDNPAGEEQNNKTTSTGDFVVEMPKGSQVSALLIRQDAVVANGDYRVELK